jgi:hypothetical protein
MDKSKKDSKSTLIVYLNKCFRLTVRAVIFGGVCYALNIGLLYFCQMLFGFYLKTPMGPEFVDANPELMTTIEKLTDMGFEQLSIPLTLTAFLTCLAILAACKLLFLARYITPMGNIGRVISCVLPISAAVAMMIPESVPVGGWGVAYGLSVFPTFVMFNSCFAIADELLPEADSLIGFFRKSEPSGKSPHVRR